MHNLNTGTLGRRRSRIPTPRQNNAPGPNKLNRYNRSVIYRAEVLEDNGTRNTYTGLTGNTFKERYYGHASSFRNRSKENSTTLSTHIWQLKDENKNYNIKWKIIDRGKIFNPTNRKCNLCLKEKYHIIFQPEGASLNKRSELFSACRHRRQKLLENVKDWKISFLVQKN